MTPQERRKAQLAAVRSRIRAGGNQSTWAVDMEDTYDALLAYFDEHEPALADATRYGVTPGLRGLWYVDTDTDKTVNTGVSDFVGVHAPLFINYPEGHPKR